MGLLAETSAQAAVGGAAAANSGGAGAQPAAAGGEAAPAVIPAPLAMPVEGSVPEAMPVTDEAPAETDPWTDEEGIFEDLPEGGESSSEIEANSVAAAAGGSADAFSSLPSGYVTPSGGYTPLASRMAGWTFGLMATMTYDSNPKLSPGWPLAPIEDDWLFTLTPNIHYRSVGGLWFVEADGTFGWNHYFSTDPSDGYDVRTTFKVGYDGPKLKADMHLTYRYEEGYNQYYYNQFIAKQYLGFGASARYRLSSKTSLTASLDAYGNMPSENQYNNTQSYRASAGMRWKATGLTVLNGGLSYSFQTGERQFDRWTLGPYIGVDYKLSAKVKFNGRIGMDFVNFDGPGLLGGGGSDQFVPVDLGLVYTASALWAMDLKVYRHVSPDGSRLASYRETFGARLGYHRKVRRVVLHLGANYETNNYYGVASVTGNDFSYYATDATLTMSIFRGRADASVFVRYRNGSGDAVYRNWDGYQIGVSLGASF
jgi:hypothetical protein